MTLNFFLSLTEEEQLTLIERRGVYIGKRKCEPFHSLLYQVETFYVELLYSRYRLHLDHILCTRSTAILDSYLDIVDIGLLVN